MIPAISPRRSGRRRPRGTTMVEAALVLLLFLSFIFMIIDVAWSIFAKATLQHAVRSAVRYAVTSQAPPTVGGKSIGYLAAVKQMVQAQSMGLLSASDLDSYVTVNFYPVGSSVALDPKTNPNANAAGNLIIVSVNAWPLNILAPLPQTGKQIHITVSSGDLIETIGDGTTPPPLFPAT